MNVQETSKLFDIVYNNITSNKAPGLNEYEKSNFLTMAQEQIVKEIYEGTRGFESSEYATEALQCLVATKKYEESDKKSGVVSLSNVDYVFDLPNIDVVDTGGRTHTMKLMYIVYEEVLGKPDGCTESVRYLVEPTTHNEFYNVIENPFRGPKGNKALRQITSENIELTLPDDIKTFDAYYIRYIRYPMPILLYSDNTSSIESDYSIDGFFKSTPCELPEFLHRTIINRAAALAKAVWSA